MTSGLLTEPLAFATCACSKDVHYAKALIGSIRYFYPGALIHVLLDDDVSLEDERQIATFPGLHTYRARTLLRSHGLPLRGLLTKLNLFFIPTLGRVVFADADSILVGPVDLTVKVDATLHMLDAAVMDPNVPANRDVFVRWAIDLDRCAEITEQPIPDQLIFAKSSHFSVNCRKFPVDLLERMLPLMGPTHSPTNVLRAGDQGFFNYLVNFPAAWGGSVAHSLATVQAGKTHRIAAYNDVAYVAKNRVKPYYFIHYVGFCRRYLRRQHEYAAPLQWATGLYYQRFGNAAFLQDEIGRMRATVCRGMKLVGKRFWRDSP